MNFVNDIRTTCENIISSNIIKYELIRDIIFAYDYTEFNTNFIEIYNHYFDNDRKYICLVIRYITDLFTSFDDDIPLRRIIESIKYQLIHEFGRKNSKLFYVDFVDIIILWTQFKINNQWITKDNFSYIIEQDKKYDWYWPLSHKVKNFTCHFDY